MKPMIKKTVAILCLLIASLLECNAQTIIPVETFYSYNKDLKAGDYIKDINGVLNKYVGVWTATYENKKFTFDIKKATVTHYGHTDDLLYMRYRITDSAGHEIINTLSLPDSSLYVIEGMKMDKDGNYFLFYQGYESDCGQHGDIALRILPEKDNKAMYFVYAPDRDIIFGCDKEAEQLFPVEKSFMLTKQ